MRRYASHLTDGLILVFAVLLNLADSVLASSCAACQRPNKVDSLDGCPPGTILVGPKQKFTTIQSAIKSIPNDNVPYTILIQPGEYRGKVNITRVGPVTLLGVTSAPNDHSRNTVTVVHKNATTTGKGDNAFTSALTVAPTEQSSLTGAGFYGYPVKDGTAFGNSDFRAYNIDFVNDYADKSAGPSLAISVSYANAGFYFCGIRSYQDTASRDVFSSYESCANAYDRCILVN
jgi:pectin methylesterase-like acyl-CoA thioesterase